jgi:hypothetical protein
VQINQIFFQFRRKESQNKNIKFFVFWILVRSPACGISNIRRILNNQSLFSSILGFADLEGKTIYSNIFSNFQIYFEQRLLMQSLLYTEHTTLSINK